MDYKKQKAFILLHQRLRRIKVVKLAFTIVELPPSLNFRRASLISNNNIKQGFTIVELLVVIVVIGILAAITIVSYTGLSGKATVASLQSDLSSAKKQLSLYQVEYGSFPASLDTSYCPNGSTPADTKYCLKKSSGNTFTYTPATGASPQAFSLIAKNNTTYYNLTNNSQPTAVTPIPEASVSATGTYTLSSDGPYRIYKFTGNGTITTTTPGTAEVLVVGGGGGGSAGGGGAGGYLTGAETLTGTMAVTIGSGGIAGMREDSPTRSNGGDGLDSIFGTRTSKGGGGGSRQDLGGRSGGSGGGAGIGSGGGVSISGQGNLGGGSSQGAPSWPGGGGGGAGSAGEANSDGSHGGNGGKGINNDIVSRGIYVGYAGGGGGSTYYVGYYPGLATHGGGDGNGGYLAGTSGVVNTGGGGGGGGGSNYGGSGGSGIVIIRYLTP